MADKFWRYLLSKVAGKVPAAVQFTGSNILVWNERDGKLFGLKINEDGTKEVVTIYGGGTSHSRAHQITSIEDHPAVDEKERGKLVATNPLTGAIELIDKQQSVIFRQTANKTITNNIVETTLFADGIGVLTIPANTLIKGSTLRIRINGLISTSKGEAPEELTLKLILGLSVLSVVVGTVSPGLENAIFFIDVLITCRNTGVNGLVMPSGAAIVDTSSEYLAAIKLNSLNVDKVLDTTKDNNINITFKWSVAKLGNSITTNVALVEYL